MANYDDIVRLINSNTYPHVARTADPLLVRPEMLSLMVGDVIYNAKIKNGLGAKGYMIYVNGNGTPIYENIAKTNSDATEKFSISFINNSTGASTSLDDASVIALLETKAKEWLDNLEKAIAKEPSDSAIKKAIDRMCWQLHYDITESHLNFPEAFSDNDFADVKIDRYPLDSTYFDGCTLKTTISDIAGVEHSVTESGTTIINQGYFSDASDRIQAFDDHLTVGAFESHVDQDTRKEVIDSGALKLIQDNIVNFDNHMTAGAWSSTVVEGVDTVNDGALNKIATKLVPDGNDYYSISECLRDKQTINGTTTFSIARSLRESGGNSVPIQEQIMLETLEIQNGLGANGSINTTLGSIKTNSDTVITRIGDFGGDTILGRLLRIDDDLDTVNTNTGTIATNTGTIADKIGDESTSGTVIRRLFLINGDTTDIKNNM